MHRRSFSERLGNGGTQSWQGAWWRQIHLLAVVGTMLLLGVVGVAGGRWALSSATPHLARALPSAQGGEAEIELVAEHGGEVIDVAAGPRHVYVVIGTRLLVLDGGFEAGERPLAVHAMDDARIEALATTGDGRLVAIERDRASRRGLVVYDLSDPLAPRALSRFVPQGTRSISGDGHLVAEGDRAWVASASGLVAFHLDGPNGPYDTGGWRLPHDARYGSLTWLSFGLNGGYLVGATSQLDRGTPGPVPTPCRDRACPTPRPNPFQRLRLWSFDVRPEAGLKRIDVVDVEGDQARAATGERWVAVAGDAEPAIVLWRVAADGALRRDSELPLSWVFSESRRSTVGIEMAMAGDHLWLDTGNQLALIELRADEPRHLGVVSNGWEQRRPGWWGRGLRMLGRSDGSVLLAEGPYGLRRAGRDRLGRALPVVAADIGAAFVYKVVADRDGAWALEGVYPQVDGLWRARNDGLLRQVSTYPGLSVERSTEIDVAASHERLFVAWGDRLGSWRDADRDATPVASRVGGGDFVAGSMRRVVASPLGSSVLVNHHGLWERWRIEEGRVTQRATLSGMGTGSGVEPVLAGDVPWALARRDGQLTLVAGRLKGQQLVPQWPGMALTSTPVALAGDLRLVAMVHTSGTTLRLTLVGWDETMQPRGLGELDMPGGGGGAAPAIALDRGVAWVAYLDGTDTVLVAVDISVPLAPRELARTKLGGGRGVMERLFVAAAPSRSWLAGFGGGQLYEFRLRRPATPTPDGPTRPPPTRRPTPEPTPTPAPTERSSSATIALPWAQR